MAPLESTHSASDFIRHQISDNDTHLFDRDFRIISRELSSGNVTGSPQLLISITCVIGGSIVLLLLVYAIRRRAAAAACPIQAQPNHGVPAKSRQNRQEDITALPMYRQDSSMDTLAQVASVNSRSDVKESPATQHWREKTTEKQITSIPTIAVKEIEPEGKTQVPSGLAEPEPALTPDPQARESGTRRGRQSPKEKIIAAVAQRATASARIRHGLDSQLNRGLDAEGEENRWSWTNSQAPTTPRVRAFSMRFSNSSLISLPPPLPTSLVQTSMDMRDSVQEAQHINIGQQAERASASQAAEPNSNSNAGSVKDQTAELRK